MKNSAEKANQAVALKYDGKHAPTVTATGTDTTAEDIIRIAQENGVPLYENPELAGILSQLELGDAIPELLYQIIAEIIAFVYMLKGEVPEGFNPHSPQEKKQHAEPARLNADSIYP